MPSFDPIMTISTATVTDEVTLKRFLTSAESANSKFLRRLSFLMEWFCSRASHRPCVPSWPMSLPSKICCHTQQGEKSIHANFRLFEDRNTDNHQRGSTHPTRDSRDEEIFLIVEEHSVTSAGTQALTEVDGCGVSPRKTLLGRMSTAAKQPQVVPAFQGRGGPSTPRRGLRHRRLPACCQLKPAPVGRAPVWCVGPFMHLSTPLDEPGAPKRFTG